MAVHSWADNERLYAADLNSSFASILALDGVMVVRSGAATLATGTEAFLNFDTEVFDYTGNYHNNVTNNTRLTIGRTALYIFGAQVEFAANATGYRQSAGSGQWDHDRGQRHDSLDWGWCGYHDEHHRDQRVRLRHLPRAGRDAEQRRQPEHDRYRRVTPLLACSAARRVTTHRHVSERTSSGPWVLCTECSAVMWQIVTGATVPATRAEACALRRAEGPDRSCEKEGSSAAQLRVGMKARWDRNAPASIGGWPALAAALVPGTAAIVMGSMGAFPDGSHWRRWDPGFTGRHATEVERRDEQSRVWWDDPLAPVGSYHGEWMPLTELERFVRGWAGARHIVAPLTGWSGGGNQPVTLIANPTNDPIGTVKVAGTGHTLVDPAGGPNRPVADATNLAVYGTAKLSAPYPGTGGDRSNVYVVSASGHAYFLLFADGIYTPDPNADRYDEGRRAEYDAVLAGIGIPPRP